MKIKVSNYISDYLIKVGINHCFMVTGGGAMHLNDAIGHQTGMNVVYNHHEQACSIAAEAYSRYSNKMAVVCVTSGPGGTNAITGVLGAWLDSIPMIVLSGQVKTETTTWSCPNIGLRQLGDQEFDIVHSVANMTKYCTMITNPKEIAFHLEKAIFLANEGRKGPVWLDIPLDVQGAMIDTEEIKHFVIEDTEHKEKVNYQGILDKIYNAKSPVLLVGTGIRLGNAEEGLLKLINKLQIPVVTAWNANDVVAYNNKYYVGMPGTVGTRSGNFVVQNCDLLLSLGCRLNIRMIGYNRFDFAKNAYKILVDIDEKELLKPTIKPDIAINCDVKKFIDNILLIEYKPNNEHKNWLYWCKKLLKKYPIVLKEYHNLRELINPYVFIDNLFKKLKSDDKIICGNGSACVITFQAAKIKQGQRMFTNSGCAAMGYGLPAALGVAVSNNNNRTVCIDGDGSIMMNLQELSTIVYNKLNIKIFVINNNGYLSIRQTQNNMFHNENIGIDNKSGIGFPSFKKIADAFGLKYQLIDTEKESEKLIEKVLEMNGPIICEVVVDWKQNFSPKSSSKVLPDGKIESTSLDDMFPFLDREEYLNIKYD